MKTNYYDIQAISDAKKGVTKSKRAKVIRSFTVSIASPRRVSASEKTVYETEEEIEDRGLVKNYPNTLIERLELLILETKAGHDGLYNEMLHLPY